MSGKRFKKSPLWGLSYEKPGLDRKMMKIHKSLKELEGALTDKSGKDKGKRKR
ncbi:MAG: hypothetical protein KH828_00040 [Clostridiales bacterium]|nr:hypothetical protein [Clostridiales bacterium]